MECFEKSRLRLRPRFERLPIDFIRHHVVPNGFQDDSLVLMVHEGRKRGLKGFSLGINEVQFFRTVFSRVRVKLVHVVLRYPVIVLGVRLVDRFPLRVDNDGDSRFTVGYDVGPEGEFLPSVMVGYEAMGRVLGFHGLKSPGPCQFSRHVGFEKLFHGEKEREGYGASGEADESLVAQENPRPYERPFVV